MTVTRPASSTSLLHHRLVRVLRRWASTPAATTPRARRPRRARRRTTLAHPPAPPLEVWGLDQAELTSALEHSRW